MGSEFVVRLPILTQRPSTSGPVSRREPPLSRPRRRVLIVDDNHDSADSLAAVLRALDHDVRTLYEGAAVIAVAEEFQPQIVLLDIGLPGMNGYEVARQLRKSAKLRSAILVALTGYGRDEDREQAREAGFDHHLMKPLEPEVLERIIESTIG